MPPRRLLPPLEAELPAVAAAAAARGGALHRSVLRDLGVADAETDRRVRAGAWTVPYRGIVVPSPAPLTSVQTASAVSLTAGPTGYATAGTTLRMLGLALREIPEHETVVGLPHRGVSDRAGLEVLQGALRPVDVTTHFGVPTTTAARACLDVVRRRPRRRRDGLVVVEAALHAGLTDLSALRDAVTRLHRHPGVGAARDVVALARVGAESPGETRLRWCLVVDSGLPEPALQYAVRDAYGRLVAVADLAYPTARLLVEYDGRDAHEAGERFARDRQRDRALGDLGWRVLRFTSADLHLGWTGAGSAVGRALAAAGVRAAA